ncbi:MAG: OmpH family outer membrane protein [Balneolales bacterium]|nr:OmpH family outer membrane protein [Balneolales bacterium]
MKTKFRTGSRHIFIVAQFFLLALLIGFPSLLNAQNQRVGYIDSDFILSKIPEYEDVEKRLRELAQKWREEITEMEGEIETLRQEFEAREILFTPEVRRERQQEIDNKLRERERFINSRFGPDGEYFRQQQELLRPLHQQIDEAMKKIAERDGYDFVFDRSGDYVFFYTRRQWNLSVDVLLELGIQVEEDVLP